MSNLTDLLPAGAGGKQVSFVASGTIGNGVTVGLNSNGTVSAVENVSAGFGSSANWDTAANYGPVRTCNIGSNKFVVFYTDPSPTITIKARIGSVSGTTITYGTEVSFGVVLGNEDRYYTKVLYDSVNDKIVFYYADASNSNYPTVRTGSISGTTITLNTAVVIKSVDCAFGLYAVHDTNANKFVSLYRNGNGGVIYTRVATINSSGAVSLGAESSPTGSPTMPMSKGDGCFDSNVNKCFFTFVDNNDQGQKAFVSTVSGTSVSTGSIQTIQASRGDFSTCGFDKSTNKVVVFYKNNYAKVVTIASDSSISLGSEYNGNLDSPTQNWGSLTRCEVVYSDVNNTLYLSGYYATGSACYLFPVTVSGTTPVFGTRLDTNIGSTATYACSAAYDNSTKQVVATSIEGASSPYSGDSVVYQLGYSNNTDFIGIADAAISNAASGSVTIKGGISTNVTGLTPNSTYYVQANGTLSTTTSSVLAGKALSSTSINLDYTT